MAFHNPYHFVPIENGDRPDDVQIADFREGSVPHLTFDRYITTATDAADSVPMAGNSADYYSGRLVCRITTEDPIVIGGRQTRPSLAEIATIDPFLIDGCPALPASSIRGLISSLAEAASNSSLRILMNSRYSVRKPMEQSLPALGMIVTDNGERRLRPLALPHMPWNDAAHLSQVPTEYRPMFEMHPFPPLKVYVNGYQNGGIERNSFLFKENPNSWSADHQDEFWALKLAGTATWIKTKDALAVATPTPHLNTKGPTPSLLGQKACPGQVPRRLAPGEAPVGDEVRGILRVLGVKGREKDMPYTKKHEIFIPYPEGIEQAPAFEITERAWEEFHALANDCTARKPEEPAALPFQVKGASRNAAPDRLGNRLQLRTGDIVFFRAEKQGGVTRVAELAVSSIWRKSVGSCHDYFSAVDPELLPFHHGRTSVTLAEQLFGFVEERSKDAPVDGHALAFASRLRFSFGLLGDQQIDNKKEFLLQPVALKILASPKPPAPPLYFFQAGKPAEFIPKTDLNPNRHHPRGRKLYVHRQAGETPWRTANANADPGQKSLVTPFNRGLRFYFSIDFDNLTRRELSLLCYALRPGASFRHKLGMGKPLGLGKVCIDPLGIFYVDRRQRYGLQMLAGKLNVLDSPRYQVTRMGGYQLSQPLDQWLNTQEWPNGLAREREAAQSWLAQTAVSQLAQGLSQQDSPGPWSSAAELAADWATSMSSEIHHTLTLLGNPDKTKEKVRYPIVKTQRQTSASQEAELYRWFVNNERRWALERSGKLAHDEEPAQVLGEITLQTQNVPRLTDFENDPPQQAS